MTRKKVDRIDTTYCKEITWLGWYYWRDRANPKRTQLEQMIADRVETLESPYHNTDSNRDIRGGAVSKNSQAERILFDKESDVQLAKYQTIKDALDHLTAKTDPSLLIALKEVYVYRNINLTGAAARYMHVAERTAYYHVRAWFEEFSDDIFNPQLRQKLQTNRVYRV